MHRKWIDCLLLRISYVLLIFSINLILPKLLVGVPNNIIITRHADKVLPNGSCLSLQGLERASALPYYFSGTPLYNNPPITHVFAAYNKGKHPHIRCEQTCKPIADHLKLPLNTKYNEHQSSALAQELLTHSQYNNTTVLICWDHQFIRSLIIALGGEDTGLWPNNVFDQVYMLTFNKGAKPTIQKSLQKLMFGDRMSFDAQPTPLPPIPVTCPNVIPNQENKKDE